MLVHTILDDKGFNEILVKGVYQTNPDLADKDFKEHYSWMAQHLNKVCPSPPNVVFPVWGFLTPVCKEGSTWPNIGIHMEIELEPNQCLISSFDKWHCKLNNWWCYPDDDFTDSYDDYFHHELNKLKYRDYLKDISLTATIFQVNEVDDAQVTYWEIKPHMIKDVYLHKGREGHPSQVGLPDYANLIKLFKEKYVSSIKRE